MERKPKRSLLTRLWIAGFVLILVTPLIPDATADEEKVTEFGRIPVLTPPEAGDLSGNGMMLINPAARRGYQIFRLPGTQTQIEAFDLDTLEHAGSATLSGHPAPGSVGAQFGEFVHAVDEATNRVYLAMQSGGVFSGFAELDGTTLEQMRFMSRVDAFQPEVDPENPCTGVSCAPTPPGINPAIRGMSFVEAIESPTSRDKILMLLQDSTGPASDIQSLIWVAQWDRETGKQDWIYRVNSCGSRRLPDDPLSRYALAVFQSPGLPYLYLACYGSGGTGQVVRLDQDGTSQPVAETAFPGPLGLIDVLADPDANRLHLKTASNEGESYWVFDGPSTSYVGVIGTTLSPVSTAAGIDERTGRLYVLAPTSVNANQQDPGGLFIADARRTPAPQAITFPAFSSPSVQRILVDPRTGSRPQRVIVRPQVEVAIEGSDEVQLVDADYFLVLGDGVEVTTDPPAADQDRFTTDTEEIPGVTGANYTGTAHAYGLRSVFVGGLEGTPPTRGTPAGSPLSFTGSPCMRPDREVVVGRVKQAALSNSLASATTIAGDAEAVTRTDVQQPATRCYPRGLTSGLDALSQESLGPVLGLGDEAAGSPWPFEPAECAGDDEVKTQNDTLGFASASTCRQSKEQLLASSVGELFSAPGVTVARAFTSVRLERAPNKGLTVRSEAVAHGIEVPEIFSIEAARTVAVAFAAGRPGTAGTEFTRELCGVRVHAEAIGADEDVFFEGCYDPLEQIEEVGEQPQVRNQVTDRPLFFVLNRALGSRGRIRVPEPDDELKHGTPGGYLASVQKNRGEEIQARIISNDASTELPGLEIIMFNDDENFGRGRQLYQIAGVDASATYGIFLPPTFEFAGAGDDGDVEPFTLQNLLTDMTGGLPEFVAPAAAVAGDSGSAPAPTNVVADVVNRVVRSLDFFARSPGEAMLAASVWFVLGLPFYLAARRRLLMSRRSV